MPSVREIRRRIRSVENTAKITKAMSMIAASKMRRAQDMALQGRPYSERLQTLLSHLAAQNHEQENLHPLLKSREVSRATIILITPDRGLTGGLHSKINRDTGQFVVDMQAEAKFVTIGRKGRDFMSRSGQDIQAVFTDMGDKPSLSDVTPAASIIINDYTTEQVDAVYIAYADFLSTTVQKPIIKPLLPIVPAELRPTDSAGYIYEPNRELVLSELLPRFVEMELYHAILESVASEQSARMVAMRSATDNANEMVVDLTLEMNKARQETITKELLDIVGGAAAVSA